MAGILLLFAAMARFGAIIKFMPQPVVTGFTSGIASIIFSSQIKDFFGLVIDKTPADFIAKWISYIENVQTFSPATLAVAAGSFALLYIMRRYAPKWPAFLFAVVGGSLVVGLLSLPVDTIGSRFGELPNILPIPTMPHFDIGRVRELMPSAFTIAFLAGIASLLSAVVADGLSGSRHRSNGELFAQGIANIASVCFGGLPATGAIARTAVNIRSHAYSPVAGMLHAMFLLAFMFFLAPFARYVPLASLAAVLIMVAWNMSETERFIHLLHGPKGDGMILVLTFGLTALVDLTVAIEAGTVTASLIFMYRMSNIVEIHNDRRVMDNLTAYGRPAYDKDDLRKDLPQDVEAFLLRGPLFFGVVSRLVDMVEEVEDKPRIYIIDMTEVPMIDSSGASTLRDVVKHCHKRKIAVFLVGLKGKPLTVTRKMHISDGHQHVRLFDTFAEALEAAKT
jgi:SulP family sulfate permease